MLKIIITKWSSGRSKNEGLYLLELSETGINRSFLLELMKNVVLSAPRVFIIRIIPAIAGFIGRIFAVLNPLMHDRLH
jgi:hypothetical protein